VEGTSGSYPEELEKGGTRAGRKWGGGTGEKKGRGKKHQTQRIFSSDIFGGKVEKIKVPGESFSTTPPSCKIRQAAQRREREGQDQKNGGTGGDTLALSNSYFVNLMGRDSRSDKKGGNFRG